MGIGLARRARQGHRLAEVRNLAELLHHVQALHLRIGERLVDRVDRPRGHAGLVEDLDPGGGIALGEIGLELVVQLVAVLGAQGAGRIIGVRGERGRADRLAHARPDLRPAHREVEVAVARLVHAGRDRGRMVVAGLLGDFAFHQPARRLEVEHEELRLQERRLHPLALAGLLALEQRDHDAVRAEDSGAQVRDRDTDAHRSLPRQSGDRHQAAHALRDLVEARAHAIGAVLAVARDAAVDQPRIDRGHRLVADAEPVLHIGAIVLHQHVGLRRELLQDRYPVGRFQIERDAAFVALQVLEVAAVARSARPFAFVEPRRHLDLDYFRAPVGELAHRGRTGAHARQIDYGDMRKRGRGRHDFEFTLRAEEDFET